MCLNKFCKDFEKVKGKKKKEIRQRYEDIPYLRKVSLLKWARKEHPDQVEGL